MKRLTSIVAAVAAGFALTACLNSGLELEGETPLTPAEIAQLGGREFVCFDIDGVAFPGIYNMYVDDRLVDNDGNPATLLAGYYANAEPGRTPTYGEIYAGTFDNTEGNIVTTEGARLIPRDAPLDISVTTRWDRQTHSQTFLFYKDGSFPSRVKASTTFLNEGQTVLGCQSKRGRPDWMSRFKLKFDEEQYSLR